MLEKLKHESEETFYKTVASLTKMEANAGTYKEAIKAAMDKIEEWQKQVCYLLLYILRPCTLNMIINY